MNYPSSFSVNPIKDADFLAAMPAIHERLESCMTKGMVSAYDGLQLAWYAYTCDKPVANMVIVHGFTEFALKYEEIITYFLEMGYNCFIFDERSHGYSGSGVEDRRYNHVESFREYSKDLHTIIDKIVRPRANGLPIRLFSHSMGGSTCLLYLHDYKPSDIDTVILSSPMIVPRMYKNIPIPIVKFAIRQSAKETSWDSKFKHTMHFNPNPDYALSHDCSPARFQHNLNLRLSDTNFQNSGSTNRWLMECLNIGETLRNKDFLRAIPQDILLLEAGEDYVVVPSKYKKVVKYLPSCKHSVYPHSKHSIYNSEDSVIVQYWNEIFDFLGTPGKQ